MSFWLPLSLSSPHSLPHVPVSHSLSLSHDKQASSLQSNGDMEKWPQTAPGFHHSNPVKILLGSQMKSFFLVLTIKFQRILTGLDWVLSHPPVTVAREMGFCEWQGLGHTPTSYLQVARGSDGQPHWNSLERVKQLVSTELSFLYLAVLRHVWSWALVQIKLHHCLFWAFMAPICLLQRTQLSEGRNWVPRWSV